MIDYQNALECLLKQKMSLACEAISLENALGRIARENIISPCDLPSFANSAMDGYAVVADATKTASKESPVFLALRASLAAGDELTASQFKTTDACEIMTGAPVPSAFNAVIKVEETARLLKEDQEYVVITKPAVFEQNIRNAGEDFKIGNTAIMIGTCLQAAHIMVLAGLGCSEVSVCQKLPIHFFCTGKELTESLTENLTIGKIRNSNRYFLQNALTRNYFSPHYEGIIQDDLAEVVDKFQSCLQTNDPKVIITTGAVSAGKWDVIPEALKQMQAEIFFHKVAIRPGKPIIFARFPNGTFFFGLPGNPVSTVVGLNFFVMPFIRNNFGIKQAPTQFAILQNTVKKARGLQCFYKAFVTTNATGQLLLTVLPGQESFKMSSLLDSNCWAILPAEVENVEAGTILPFVLMN